MMKKLRLTLIIAALSLGATALLPSNALAVYAPAQTVYGAGSSAMFNTIAIAAGVNNAWPGNTAFCGPHHWTQGNGAQLVDPRSGSIAPEKGNIWIVWDDNAVNQVAPGRVCVYIAVDSIVGVRAYFAHATIGMISPAGTADANIVPLLGAGESLPTNIFNEVNGAEINVAYTDIRPEDAKFATIRVLTSPAGTRIPRNAYTGLGYGPSSIGTPIYSSRGSGSTCPGSSCKQANPVDFTISGPDPVTLSGTPRAFKVASVGADPVMVIANVSNTASGHLGDGNYKDVNRQILANVLTGQITHIRDIANIAGEPDAPLHVWQREPLSGTFNTMEFCIPLSREMYYTYYGPGTYGTETGVNPANTSCTTHPCAVESGNPFYHITTTGGAVGATRGRVIGTGEMVSTVNSVADSIGYAFWGYSNFQGQANLKYMTVDGIDPLYAAPGGGTLPQCTGSPVTSCPALTFPNIANGYYPIWSILRAVYDPTDETLVINPLIAYAQHAAVSLLPDFVPATALQVFRSHFNQIAVTSNSDDIGPNNGIKFDVPETGGDMGGAVLTVQSEVDYITDTGGSQQVNLFQ